MRGIFEGQAASMGLLTDMAAGTGTSVGIQLDLIDQSFIASQGLDLSTISVASYPGYAQQTGTLSLLEILNSGAQPEIAAQELIALTFPVPSSGPAVEVYGILVTYNGATPGRWAALPFNSPLALLSGTGKHVHIGRMFIALRAYFTGTEPSVS